MYRVSFFSIYVNCYHPTNPILLDDKSYEDGSDSRSSSMCTFYFCFDESVGCVDNSVGCVDESIVRVCGVELDFCSDGNLSNW